MAKRQTSSHDQHPPTSFKPLSASSHVSHFPALLFQRLSTPPQQLGGSVSSALPPLPSQGESSPCSEVSSYEGPPSPLSAASSGAQGAPGERASDPEGGVRELPLLTQHFLPSDPTQWNVEEVYEFIRSLPGQCCREMGKLLYGKLLYFN